MATHRAVVEKMLDLAKTFEAKQDNRTIFLYCYSMMTDNMLLAIEQERFKDNAWVERLLHRFAEYYFEALTCYDCGAETPAVWHAVHVAASTKKLHVIQHLLLGVNAHINYDLVLSLYDVLAEDWNNMTDEMRDLRYQDHCLVNEIIGNTIDKVQDEVVERFSPMMNVIDRIMGRLDEMIILKMISEWRDSVWHHTQEMLVITQEEERNRFRNDLERKVLKRADWLDTQFRII
ncbi:MAG: DUF5995 family protein [Chitinophagales bacterium]